MVSISKVAVSARNAIENLMPMRFSGFMTIRHDKKNPIKKLAKMKALCMTELKNPTVVGTEAWLFCQALMRAQEHLAQNLGNVEFYEFRKSGKVVSRIMHLTVLEPAGKSIYYTGYQIV